LFDGSGVNREVHAPFCERPGGKFLWPTLRDKVHGGWGCGYYGREYCDWGGHLWDDRDLEWRGECVYVWDSGSL